MSAGLRMFTLYERPEDYPEHCVAREWIAVGGQLYARTGEPLKAACLDVLREHLEQQGYHPIPRAESDALAVVETWL